MVMKLKGKAKRISLMSKRSNKKGCKTEKVIARNFGSFSRQMKVDKKKTVVLRFHEFFSSNESG